MHVKIFTQSQFEPHETYSSGSYYCDYYYYSYYCYYYY